MASMNYFLYIISRHLLLNIPQGKMFTQTYYTHTIFSALKESVFKGVFFFFIKVGMTLGNFIPRFSELNG